MLSTNLRFSPPKVNSNSPQTPEQSPAPAEDHSSKTLNPDSPNIAITVTNRRTGKATDMYMHMSRIDDLYREARNLHGVPEGENFELLVQGSPASEYAPDELVNIFRSSTVVYLVTKPTKTV